MVIQLITVDCSLISNHTGFLLEQSALPGGFSADLDPSIVGVKENQTGMERQYGLLTVSSSLIAR